MRLKRLFHICFRQHRKSIIFCLFLSLFLILLVITQRLFSVSVITVSGSATLKGLDRLSNRLIFLISPSGEAQQLYSANPDLKKVTVVKQYPHTLQIIVERDSPIGLLVVTDGFFYLSSSGRIVAKKKTKDSSLPLITLYQQLNFNEYIAGELLTNPDISFSLFFIQQLASQGITIDAVDVNSANMVVLELENRRYLLSSEKDKNSQYGDFQTVYHRLKVQGLDYRVLDLRFDKPIITLNRET